MDRNPIKKSGNIFNLPQMEIRFSITLLKQQRFAGIKTFLSLFDE